MTTFSATTREDARLLDQADDLRSFRERFLHPETEGGQTRPYFCGNSLGLQPAATRADVEAELDDWAHLAVDGHREARSPWYTYHEQFRDPMARIVGAKPNEVVLMNSLTVNLHLMFVTFYRPEGRRRKVLMEAPAFPSDTYAVQTHVASRGVDPAEAIVTIAPRDGEHTLHSEDVLAKIAEIGDELAMVLIGGVNYFTGQYFDLAAITRAAHDVGATAGFDLAHAAGNVPLALHDWDVDFACWCTYKYLNGGPGSIAGCFVHERHGKDTSLPRFAGWWGNDPDTRFRMHLEDQFVARPDADGWQISNPPILSLTPLRASLALFDEAGMERLRAKSLQLTGFLEKMLDAGPQGWFEMITPRDPEQRGCQLSLRVIDHPRERFESIVGHGIVVDFRKPNVIRVAPAPLYTSFEDVWQFADAIASIS